MLILLSPAKSLDYDSPISAEIPHTLPQFIAQSEQLIDVLRQKSPQAIASLMGISDKLAALNAARYTAWTPKFTPDNARQAVLAFNGDVYDGLQAGTLTLDDLQWAQQHLAILSGLYGVLRPLDWMQPYRLEMGTAVEIGQSHNLYKFWGNQIAHYINHQLQADSSPLVLNLASQEYFKSVDRKTLQARVVECVFEDWKNSTYKVISFHAKKARGAMARYAITQRAKTTKDLQSFTDGGYAWDASASSADRLVFRRKLL
jgi:uncharacterized protein